MSELRIKLLTGRSGLDGSFLPGDKVALPLQEAISLIQSGQAEAVDKKGYKAAIEQLQVEREQQAMAQAEQKAVLEKERLQNELRELYRQTVLKVAQIEGVVLSEEEIETAVEEKMHGTPLDKKDGED